MAQLKKKSILGIATIIGIFKGMQILSSAEKTDVRGKGTTKSKTVGEFIIEKKQEAKRIKMIASCFYYGIMSF